MLTSLNSLFDGISSLIWFTSSELQDNSLTVSMGKSTSLVIHDKPLIHWELLFISSSVVPRLVPRSAIVLDVCVYCHWSGSVKRLISIILLRTHCFNDRFSLLIQCKTIWLSVNLKAFVWCCPKALLFLLYGYWLMLHRVLLVVESFLLELIEIVEMEVDTIRCHPYVWI